MSEPQTSAGGAQVVPVEQFVKCLSDSGLLPADEVQAFLGKVPSPQRKDTKQLAQELVRQQKLTRYQATMLCQGKIKGLVLGNYAILDKIGAGGMGMVFKARHQRMKRVVALKVLAPAITKNPTAVQRFQREVEAAAQLSHPNIVTAHDASEDKGVHYLVMEFVEGSDLSSVVKKQGVLSIAQALNCVLQAAQGLKQAHEVGIIHRDIKPANLLLDTKGTVKILDMGLARIESAGKEGMELTQSGSIMGTCDYMSPEQALNTKHADARSDIYSLGCTLYYLLAGKTMYGGETAMEKLMAHQSSPIPALREARPEISKALETVYQKLVAKKPEDRYQTMQQAIADLEKCDAEAGQTDSLSVLASGAGPLPSALHDGETLAAVKGERTQTAYQPKYRSRRRWLIGGVAGAVLALVAGLAVIRVETDQGTFVIETDDEKVAVMLNKTGITIHDQTTDRKYNLKPGRHDVKTGEYEIEVSELPDGVALSTKQFTIKRGQEVKVKVRVEKAVAKPKESDETWIKSVAALPAEKQVEEVVKKLKERNPGFDGKETHKVEGEVVVELSFITDNVKDISPVRALSGLRSLNCTASSSALRGKLADLSPLRNLSLTNLRCSFNEVPSLEPLKGMALTGLGCEGNKFTDLSPLKGMPLKSLDLHSVPVSDLSPLKGMPLTYLVCSATQVKDLSPLKGLPLDVFHCHTTPVSDLSPLKGMSFSVLGLRATQVKDLSPLKGIVVHELNIQTTPVTDLSPLKEVTIKNLECDFKPERDTEILRSIKSLEKINGKPVSEFLKAGGAANQTEQEWIKSVASLPPEKQVEEIAKKLKELNPGFDETPPHQVEGNMVTELRFNTDKVSNIAPVRALKGLKRLWCHGSGRGKGQLKDLTPLGGLPLERLECFNNADLFDLSPLKGMALKELDIAGSKVSDLSPLHGMPLWRLGCPFTQVSDLSPLKGMPLTGLNCLQTRVSDFGPLKDTPLKLLACDFRPERDAEILRSIKTLEKINDKPVDEVLPKKP